MAEVALRHDLLEPLRWEAERQGISLDDFVNTLLSQHLAQTRREKLLAEFEIFQAKHATLRARYLGEYVAMREGQVIDHGLDCRALHLRVLSRYGRAPVLIAQVTDKPVQKIGIRSPRLESVRCSVHLPAGNGPGIAPNLFPDCLRFAGIASEGRLPRRDCDGEFGDRPTRSRASG